MKHALEFQSLEDVWASFSPIYSRFYALGPFRLCLSAPSTCLLDLFARAFSHLEIEDAPQSDLSIRIWQPDTKHRLPRLDWTSLFQSDYKGFVEPPFYFHFFQTPSILSVLDTSSQIAHCIFPDYQLLPWWVFGSPFQPILHAWLRCQGMHLAHAAAIGDGKKALLLVGKGGSGKSTTTLACLEKGLFYLAEDYCIVSLDPTPKVYSLYHSAKWQAHTRALFPSYDPYIVNPAFADREKALLFLNDLFPGKLQKEGTAQMLVSLKRTSLPKAKLEESSLFSTIGHFSLSTLKQLPFPHPQSTHFLQKFAQEVDRKELFLSPNLATNVELLQELLK